MQFTEGMKTNFETLKRAAINGDLALVDCFDVITGESLGCIYAINRENNEYEMVPLAIMPYQSLYERVLPPKENGAYYSEE